MIFLLSIYEFLLTGTDADNYSIQFNQDAQLGAPEKLSLIGAQVLTDYMLFDGNTEKCQCTNDGEETET
jgi:hypothetical protein